MKKTVVVLAGSVIALSVTAASARHNAPDDARARRLATEAVRLRAHFDSVDGELRRADISGLSASQKEMRSQLISWLRDYRNAGSFPENDRFANRMVPFFRDSHGTLCAMAYLIDRSGRGDIVDKVASTRNNAYIHELADDPALIAWLDASGLSLEEAARIQPTYGGGPTIIVENNDGVSEGYAVVSMGLGAASMGATGLNLFAPSRASGSIGFISGVASIAAGGEHLRDRGGNKRMAQANLTVGSVAVVSALYALFRVKPLASGAATKPTTATAGLTWSPQLDLVGTDARVGVGLHARF